MDKNNRLINIYIKIHNKRTITMEELQYLAKYDPECFRKTCVNVVYNMPETMEVMAATRTEENTETDEPGEYDKFNVQAILENLKKMDAEETFYKEVDVKRVKNLLGNLFMELLFPHNDKETFIGESEEDKPRFDMKA